MDIFRKIIQKSRVSDIKSVPIFIYQMGRVGSNSIKVSLEQTYRSLDIKPTILNGHFLNKFDLLEERVQKDLQNTANFMHDLIDVKKTFNDALEEIPENQKIKLISLVRDPVARNVSTFFFALDEFIPGWKQRIEKGTLTMNDIHKLFISKRTFVLTAFYWFEEQMEPVFDIDVYSKPFPKEKGYKIYSSPKADLLLMRLESLKHCATNAFHEFLDITNFKISKVNAGEDRKAGELYRLYKTQPLPSEYVEWSYSFKLARHFYTPLEIEAFVSKWISPGANLK